MSKTTCIWFFGQFLEKFVQKSLNLEATNICDSFCYLLMPIFLDCLYGIEFQIRKFLIQEQSWIIEGPLIRWCHLLIYIRMKFLNYFVVFTTLILE